MNCDFAVSPGHTETLASSSSPAIPDQNSPSPAPTPNSAQFIPWSPNSTNPTTRATTPLISNPSTPQPENSTAPRPLPPLTPLPSEQDLSLDVTDLSLLHHFTTATAPTLSPWSPELQHWWAYDVPRLALAHPFVMRSLLALAGLHLARTSSPSSPLHTQRAIAQHQLALRAGRAALLDADVSAEMSAPLYVFAVLTMVISMALPREPGALSLFVGDGDERAGTAAEWVRLMRGIKAIADPGRAWLVARSDVGVALREELRPGRLRRRCARGEEGLGDSGGGRRAAAAAALTDSTRHDLVVLAGLREFIEADMWADKEDGQQAEQSRQVCLRALDELSNVFSAFLDHGENVITTRLAFSWLCQADDQFLVQLRENRPHALLIVGHFAVLLRRIDRTWWLEGWGVHIVSVVASTVGTEYQRWLQWPVEQVMLS